MKTVLLTGANGFIGSHLLRHLVYKKYQLVILKRSFSNLSRIIDVFDKVESYDIDICSKELAFRENKIDAVIHLATSYGRLKQDSSIEEANILGKEIIELCIKYNVGLFINTDSFFNNGKSIQSHLSKYTETKQQFVEWLQSKKELINIVNMKLHHVYGEDDSPEKFCMWFFNELNKEKENIKLTQGLQLRDFIYVKDVVRAYETVLKKQKFVKFQNFNIATGVKYSVKDFCIIMAMEIFNDAEVVKNILNFGAIKTNKDEIMDVDNNIRDLKNLGWKPKFNLRDGINEMTRLARK